MKGKECLWDACPSCDGTKRKTSKICRWCLSPAKRIEGLANQFRSSPTDDCILWTGFLTNRGYGAADIAGKRTGAHRLMYEEFHGPIPNDLFILHKCDNRPCVNPSHLFLGTAQDNVDDMVAKVRNCRGERQGGSKLKEQDVVVIRVLSSQGSTYQSLGERYDVSWVTIRDAVQKKTWRHLP